MILDEDTIISYTQKLDLLYVEDSIESMEFTLEMFEDFFNNIVTAKDGKEALEKLSMINIDIIITDINMPVMNGLDFIKKVRSKNRDIPILVLSAYSDSSYFIDSIKYGVNGYILKPIDHEQMMDAFSNIVEKFKLKDELQEERKKLEEINTDLEMQMIQKIAEVYKLNDEILETQREVVFTMGAIGESRSKETGNHVKRVAFYSEIFAKYYGLSSEQTQLLKEASPMHDIGKVGIPDSILNKQDKLTLEEKKIMDTHTSLGYEMLKHSKRELLKTAATISHEHHEKWDGNGYPNGLKGEEISIVARITAIADVFDALGSERCYKKAWSDDRIEELLINEKGKHFDPKLVDIFFERKEEFHKIREEYKDVF